MPHNELYTSKAMEMAYRSENVDDFVPKGELAELARITRVQYPFGRGISIEYRGSTSLDQYLESPNRELYEWVLYGKV